MNCTQISDRISELGQESPLPLVIAMAFARGFSSDSISALDDLIGQALSAQENWHGKSSQGALSLATAAAHVLRLRQADHNFEARISLAMKGLEKQVKGIDGFNCMVALILRSNGDKYSKTAEEMARRLLAHDPTLSAARAAFAVLLRQSPQVLSDTWLDLQLDPNLGIRSKIFAHVTDPNTRPLLTTILDRGHAVAWPVRMSAILGMASLRNGSGAGALEDILRNNSIRNGAYPGDRDLFEKAFREGGDWDHLPGLMRVLETTSEDEGVAQYVGAIVEDFLDKNSRLGHSMVETAPAQKSMLAILGRQDQGGGVASLCFRALGRIGSIDQIDDIIQMGRRLGMESEAETAKEMILKLTF